LRISGYYESKASIFLLKKASGVFSGFRCQVLTLENFWLGIKTPDAFFDYLKQLSGQSRLLQVKLSIVF
jgi:hypothetical protein